MNIIIPAIAIALFIIATFLAITWALWPVISTRVLRNSEKLGIVHIEIGNETFPRKCRFYANGPEGSFWNYDFLGHKMTFFVPENFRPIWERRKQQFVIRSGQVVVIPWHLADVRGGINGLNAAYNPELLRSGIEGQLATAVVNNVANKGLTLKTMLIIGTIILVAAGAFFWYQNNQKQPTTDPSTAQHSTLYGGNYEV